ncbi:IclR family transcriptional regulator [Serinibacter arcticus]|uniref:Glycerol operon regulatory protein n=1 Tax=Serinibacter arcticus TaxID=1655435 RepID=A0A2U1ZSP1_9MICO|nr:IclR family transcriptional regulator [Serinibacter arcticus]PWD49942.1 IclR family transcriptional regulator [Serinibacter arcticus]
MTTSPVESIDRALLVLVALAEAGPDGASLATLADRVGVHKTTLHRALAALSFRGFVSQDPASGVYRLGPAGLTLGDGYLGGDNLAVVLHPALVALSREVDELVHLGVLVGAQIVYLDKVEPQRPVRVWSAVGRRMPAATTALGRALLLDRVGTRAALAPYLEPGTTEAVADRAWSVISGAAATGFVHECEENEPGIACVAVPLVRGGATVAAVSVTAPRERFDDERLAEVARAMRTVLPALLPPGVGVRPV